MLPELSHELLRGFRVALQLGQETQNFALIVDRTSEPLEVPLDNDHHFIKVPMITGLRSDTAQVSGDGVSKLQKPAGNGLVRNFQASLGKHVLNIAEAQSKPGI